MNETVRSHNLWGCDFWRLTYQFPTYSSSYITNYMSLSFIITLNSDHIQRDGLPFPIDLHYFLTNFWSPIITCGSTCTQSCHCTTTGAPPRCCRDKSPLCGGQGLPRDCHLARGILHMTGVFAPYPPSERWRGL